MTSIDIIRPILDDFLVEEPLARHTSFRVGGPAEILAKPQTTEELTKIWETCRLHNIPLTIIGDGTNVLVADTGLRGVVVSTNKMNDVEICEDGRMRVQAGGRLSKVAEIACKAGFGGFEFASGIPGTVGGAIYMNSGAFGHNIGEFCESVTLLNDSGVLVKPGVEMEFDYRKSYAQLYNLLVLEAVFKLSPGGKEEEIRAKMTELNNRRRQTQPLDFPSAGSTFKRPPGFFAGKLIEDSNLKGFTIGGAQVSEKHAGFIINTGTATAQDIFDLITAIRQRVFDNFNVWMEPEVRLLGWSKNLK